MPMDKIKNIMIYYADGTSELFTNPVSVYEPDNDAVTIQTSDVKYVTIMYSQVKKLSIVYYEEDSSDG